MLLIVDCWNCWNRWSTASATFLHLLTVSIGLTPCDCFSSVVVMQMQKWPIKTTVLANKWIRTKLLGDRSISLMILENSRKRKRLGRELQYLRLLLASIVWLFSWGCYSEISNPELNCNAGINFYCFGIWKKVVYFISASLTARCKMINKVFNTQANFCFQTDRWSQFVLS